MSDREFATKWVIPFYQKIGHFYADENELAEAYRGVASELNPSVVETLLSERNWRTSSTAAWFAAIRRWTQFEAEIIEYLHRCDRCYEGGAFLLALASFATPTSTRGVTTYLDRYLVEEDPYGSQADAMCALKWLDHKNGTSLIDDYESSWNDFCRDGRREFDCDRFFRHLKMIERLQDSSEPENSNG